MVSIGASEILMYTTILCWQRSDSIAAMVSSIAAMVSSIAAMVSSIAAMVSSIAAMMPQSKLLTQFYSHALCTMKSMFSRKSTEVSY